MCADGNEPKTSDYMVPVEELDMENVKATYNIIAPVLYT